MNELLLTEIENLNNLRLLADGLPVYFKNILRGDDDVISVGAAFVLLNNGDIDDSDLPRILDLSKISPMIRLRAFNFYLSSGQIKSAKVLTELNNLQSVDLVDKYIHATYANEHKKLQSIELQNYFNTCDLSYLERGAIAAEAEGGFRASFPILRRAILIDPKNSKWPFELAQQLYSAGLDDLLERLCSLFDDIGIYPNLSMLFRANIHNRNNEPDRALSSIKLIELNKLPRQGQNLFSATKAEAFEKSGEFNIAYRAYEEMNLKLRTSSYTAGGFINHISQSLKYEFESVEDDDYNDQVIQLLGFPRSGTTLLENILDCHPDIETFEEIPSFASVRMMLDRRANVSAKMTRTIITEAREIYLGEVMRHRKNSTNVLIDKMPIMSAYARLFKYIFPNKKFIFSIRHPYDVVLSCFKQAFTPNLTMDSFTDFGDTCATYDFVMSQWFSVFTLDSPRVYYVRYNDLVTSMRPTIERVFSFLGLEWVDDVNNFSRKAEARPAKTPSYFKVRQGLALDVQSSWKNYRFLFEKPEARVLDKWVSFFGYSTN